MMGLYLSLTKPRMVMGNMLVAVAAFVFGSWGAVDWSVFAFFTAGLSLVIGSGCVFNNYYDRFLDARMERTKNRALAVGTIKPGHALVLGTLLLASGAVMLFYTTLPALYAALIGFIFYALFYTPLKHISGHSLFVGAVAGAMPPVAGYLAASPTLDTNVVLLFLALFFWQIPHFIAIANYRFDEYTAGNIPLLIKKSPSENRRGLSRKVFHYSLVLLLLFSAGLILAYPLALILQR